jgi:hypothetical protein
MLRHLLLKKILISYPDPTISDLCNTEPACRTSWLFSLFPARSLSLSRSLLPSAPFLIFSVFFHLTPRPPELWRKEKKTLPRIEPSPLRLSSQGQSTRRLPPPTAGYDSPTPRAPGPPSSHFPPPPPELPKHLSRGPSREHLPEQMKNKIEVWDCPLSCTVLI